MAVSKQYVQPAFETLIKRMVRAMRVQPTACAGQEGRVDNVSVLAAKSARVGNDNRCWCKAEHSCFLPAGAEAMHICGIRIRQMVRRVFAAAALVIRAAIDIGGFDVRINRLTPAIAVRDCRAWQQVIVVLRILRQRQAKLLHVGHATVSATVSSIHLRVLENRENDGGKKQQATGAQQYSPEP